MTPLNLYFASGSAFWLRPSRKYFSFCPPTPNLSGPRRQSGESKRGAERHGVPNVWSPGLVGGGRKSTSDHPQQILQGNGSRSTPLQCRDSGIGDERGRTGTTDRSQVSRVGLEPTTSGLTYRTGFHPPLPLRSGLYHLPRPNRWGAARKVSEDSGQGRPFLLIAQSGGLSRTRYLPDAYRRLSGCPSIWSSSTSGLTARALRS